MKRHITTLCVGGVLALALIGVAIAGPLEDIHAAYRRGDYPTAMRLARPLAAQGNADAQFGVGLMYDQGQGVPQDYAQAFVWYRKAAEQGHAAAQFNIALMYDVGHGVPQDYVQAHMWFNLAASRAPDAIRAGAVKGPDEVAAKMTPAQIAEAQRLADEWNSSSRVGDARGSERVPSVSTTASARPQDHFRRNGETGEVQLYRSDECYPDCTSNNPLTNPLEPPAGVRREAVVTMVSDGGTFKVPVTINGHLTLKFVVDSGAADVSIPEDVVRTLLITDADFLGKQTYKLADGSTVRSQLFVIRTLKVGDKTLENVVGGIAPDAGSLLLGQSFLSRFKSWSIDNQKRALILNY